MENRGIVSTILILFLIVLVGYWAFNSREGRIVRQSVNNFIECQKYGYPVTGTYPRQCTTPSGQIFAESSLVASVGSYGAPVYPAYSSSSKTLYPAYPGSMSATASKAYITYPIASSSSSSAYSARPSTSSSYTTSTTSYSVSDPQTITYSYPEPAPSGGCYVGGCSNHICSDQPGAISTCEYREEYACYQSAGRCERQANGACGWTPTPGLMACLNSR